MSDYTFEIGKEYQTRDGRRCVIMANDPDIGLVWKVAFDGGQWAVVLERCAPSGYKPVPPERTVKQQHAYDESGYVLGYTSGTARSAPMRWTIGSDGKPAYAVRLDDDGEWQPGPWRTNDGRPCVILEVHEDGQLSWAFPTALAWVAHRETPGGSGHHPAPPVRGAVHCIDDIEQRLAIAEARIESFEALAAWAITVESRNTDRWMRGFAAHVNGHLIREGDARRCAYDGRRLQLRNARQLGDSDESDGKPAYAVRLDDSGEPMYDVTRRASSDE